MTATETICKLFFAYLMFFPEAETNSILQTSSCSFFLLFCYEGLPWYEYVVWVSLLPHSLLDDFCVRNTAHGYSRITKEPLDTVQDEIEAYKTLPFYRSASLINLALFMLSSYHHRLKTESQFANIRITEEFSRRSNVYVENKNCEVTKLRKREILSLNSLFLSTQSAFYISLYPRKIAGQRLLVAFLQSRIRMRRTKQMEIKVL